MRIIWLFGGLLSLGLGLIGVVLPLLPTVPFLLLATFCFARSSEKLHHWLLSHKTFGPMISDWNRSGAIRPKAKRAATLSIVAVFGLSLVMGVKTTVLVIQMVVLSAVLFFIWTRPNG
ncbi:Inner membrane protein YbaN [Shimia sp. SK013]|uniref:YbaN family protein n=1 Tax=Shimia sp. SK013 TaxID=1389006 RepID=UPI0006B67430|nr:YbaN family protein [Shimia sp. SK013]KPA19832.1 Inner membrane protein YbaN [Shimia sp. SK013]